MTYLKNGWNFVHLFGSAVLFFLFSTFLNFDSAALWSFISGVAWEVGDESYKRFNFKSKLAGYLFDKNGFDYRDIIMNVIGIAIGLLLLYFLFFGYNFRGI